MVRRLVAAFSFSLSCCDAWFSVVLLRYLVFRCLIVTFYLCVGDLDRRNKLDENQFIVVSMFKTKVIGIIVTIVLLNLSAFSQFIMILT